MAIGASDRLRTRVRHSRRRRKKNPVPMVILKTPWTTDGLRLSVQRAHSNDAGIPTKIKMTNGSLCISYSSFLPNDSNESFSRLRENTSQFSCSEVSVLLALSLTTIRSARPKQSMSILMPVQQIMTIDSCHSINMKQRTMVPMKSFTRLVMSDACLCTVSRDQTNAAITKIMMIATGDIVYSFLPNDQSNLQKMAQLFFVRFTLWLGSSSCLLLSRWKERDLARKSLEHLGLFDILRS